MSCKIMVIVPVRKKKFIILLLFMVIPVVRRGVLMRLLLGLTLIVVVRIPLRLFGWRRVLGLWFRVLVLRFPILMGPILIS